MRLDCTFPSTIWQKMHCFFWNSLSSSGDIFAIFSCSSLICSGVGCCVMMKTPKCSFAALPRVLLKCLLQSLLREGIFSQLSARCKAYGGHQPGYTGQQTNPQPPCPAARTHLSLYCF